MSDNDDAPEAVLISDSATGHERRSVQVPVTLVTGFLGAGKTSLVRHILTGNHGYRIAVIMNEFGDSVEGSYFETEEGTKTHLGEWVDLANGCMCCAVKSEFVQAIESLMEDKRENFDYILIETTGLADPGPIAQALWTDDELEAGVQLDSIVSVVDVINISRQLNESRAPPGVTNEAQVQIAYADVIILNKLDLAAEEAVSRAEADVLAINSNAQIIKTQHSCVDLSLILNRGGFNGHRIAPELDTIDEAAEESEGQEVVIQSSPSLIDRTSDGNGREAAYSRRSINRSRSKSRSRAKSSRRRGSLSAYGGSDDGSSSEHHNMAVQSLTLRSHKEVDLEKLKHFMDSILWDKESHPEDIYRCKGLISVQGSGKKHVLQAVYQSYDIKPTSDWTAEQERGTALVIIGKHLQKEKLREEFEKNVC